MDKKKRDNMISLVIVFVVVVALVVMARVENGVSRDNSGIRINGIYGTVIRGNEIQDILLVDTLPRIERRINGASFMSIRKGIFRLEGIQRARLYIHADGGPYLRVNAEDLVVFINYRDEQKTRAAYADLRLLLE